MSTEIAKKKEASEKYCIFLSVAEKQFPGIIKFFWQNGELAGKIMAQRKKKIIWRTRFSCYLLNFRHLHQSVPSLTK